jgi:thiol-disulfide isomerase/thioredoxin
MPALGFRLLASLAFVSGSVSAAGSPDAKARTISERIRGREVAASMRPLEHPRSKAAADAAHMRDEDLVFGVAVAGRARAYPWWILKGYHVVNDELGGVPLAVAFCEQCTGAAAFRRELERRRLSFEVPGVYNGTIVLQDRETRTLWAPFSGRALEGRLDGRHLERLPVSLLRWDEWRQRHPETDVVWEPAASRDGHGSWYEPGKWGIVSEMGATLQGWDARLPENALVYGVEAESGSKAFPLASLDVQGGVVNDEVGGVPLAVAAKGAFEVAAFERSVKGRVLTFLRSQDGGGAMTDRETGSQWTGTGDAVAGPLQGERLKNVDGYLVEWHVWSAYNPTAALYDAGPPGRAASTSVASVVPPLVLQRLDGPAEAVRLPGAVNLLAVWAPWCPPCAGEMPRLEALFREYAAHGLSASGMAVLIPEEFEVDSVRRFVASAALTFPMYLVDEDSYAQLESLSRETGGPGLVLPTIFAADRQSKILRVFRGRDVESLRGAVERWLAATPAP